MKLLFIFIEAMYLALGIIFTVRQLRGLISKGICLAFLRKEEDP